MRTNLLVLSDTHVGSIYGLLPPGFVSSDDREVAQNPGQKHLWNCWEHMTSVAAKMGIDAIVHNGDVIDGAQRRQAATESCLPLLADQSEAASDILEALKKKLGNPAIYMVAGTEYHDGDAARELDAVGRNVGAVRYTGLGTGKYSRDNLDLDIDGVVVDFSHHIGSGGGVLRASAIDREAIWSALAGKEGKAPKADVVVRSHLHYYTHVDHESKHGFITPCWQLQTRFMRKMSRFKLLPSIGALVLTIDPNAKKVGLDPISVTKILYPLPELKAVKLVRE